MIRLFKGRNKEPANKLEIRPKTLNEFIGQENAAELIRLGIDGARARRRNLDHTIIYGPPGVGKTTLAQIIGNETGRHVTTIAGPSLDSRDMIEDTLHNLYKGDILFIDEIHGVKSSLQEILYSALEDGEIDGVPIADVTVIGGTTKLGSITQPMRDRFPLKVRLDHYGIAQLTDIAKRTAKVLNINITEEAARKLAEVSRGTPRILNGYASRCYDMVLSDNKIAIDSDVVESTLRLLGIDNLGLDAVDRSILLALQRAGRPVGLNMIAVTIQEDVKTVSDMYEPYLIKQGLIVPTSRGRVITERGIEHVRKHQGN